MVLSEEKEVTIWKKKASIHSSTTDLSVYEWNRLDARLRCLYRKFWPGQWHSFKSIAKSPFSRRKERETTICRLYENLLYTILVSPHKLPFRVNTKRIRRVGMIGQCPVLPFPSQLMKVRLACLWEGLFLSRKFILTGIHLLIRVQNNSIFL